ncbi:MAG: hypothetical protein HQL27_09955 [Candidatus Omnitrophica bacterium]|nr:hypothetical protein [Candidatus Omnitrophota bacterium]
MPDYFTDPLFLAMDIDAFQSEPSFWNGLGLVLDIAAYFVPGVPSFAGVTIRGVSGFSKAEHISSVGRFSKKTSKVMVANDITKLAVKNIKNTDKTVLGHFPDYINKAKRMNASYFDIGKEWNQLNKSGRKAVNKKFLDIIADKGDQIYLSNPKKTVKEGSALADELEYLTTEKGYQWINQWSLMKK